MEILKLLHLFADREPRQRAHSGSFTQRHQRRIRSRLLSPLKPQQHLPRFPTTLS